MTERAMYPAFDTAPATNNQPPMAATTTSAAENQAFISNYVTITEVLSGRNMAFLNFRNYTDPMKPNAPLDFTQYIVSTTTPPLAEQEANPESPFSTTKSVFTIAHLTPALLNLIGKPLAGAPAFVCIIPPEPTPGASVKARANYPGRRFIGLAIERETSAFIAYRSADAEQKQIDQLTRPKVKEVFAMFNDDEVLRALVVESNNKRIASFTFGMCGCVITFTIPYVPTSMVSMLRTEHAKALREAKAASKPSKAPPKSAVAAALDGLRDDGDDGENDVDEEDDDDEVEDGEIKAEEAAKVVADVPKALVPSSPKPAVVVPPKPVAVVVPPKPAALKDIVANDDEEEDRRPTKVPKTLAAVAAAAAQPPKSVAEPDDRVVVAASSTASLSPLQVKELVMKPAIVPIVASKKRDAPDAPVAPHKLRRIALAVPIDGRLMKPGDAITPTNVVAHFRAKFNGTMPPSMLPNKQTADGIARDEQSRARLITWANLTAEFFPSIFGLAPDIDIDAVDAPDFSYADFF